MSSIINNEPNFRQDLEFVCCLANPQYLNSLATQGYFDDEAFIRYLKYLLYFKRPEYVKYILFPHCLFFLEGCLPGTQTVATPFMIMLHPQESPNDHTSKNSFVQGRLCQ